MRRYRDTHCFFFCTIIHGGDDVTSSLKKIKYRGLSPRGQRSTTPLSQVFSWEDWSLLADRESQKYFSHKCIRLKKKIKMK